MWAGDMWTPHITPHSKAFTGAPERPILCSGRPRRHSNAHLPPTPTPLCLPRAQAAVLSVLPAMCADPSTAMFALRALQPLAAPSAPPHLRALALRLSVEGWQLTRRGWQRAEAAINGCAPPSGLAPPLPLRLARTALIRWPGWRRGAGGGCGLGCDVCRARARLLCRACDAAAVSCSPQLQHSTPVADCCRCLGTTAVTSRAQCPWAGALLSPTAPAGTLPLIRPWRGCLLHTRHPNMPHHTPFALTHV